MNYVEGNSNLGSLPLSFPITLLKWLFWRRRERSILRRAINSIKVPGIRRERATELKTSTIGSDGARIFSSLLRSSSPLLSSLGVSFRVVAFRSSSSDVNWEIAVLSPEDVWGRSIPLTSFERGRERKSFMEKEEKESKDGESGGRVFIPWESVPGRDVWDFLSPCHNSGLTFYFP